MRRCDRPSEAQLERAAGRSLGHRSPGGDEACCVRAAPMAPRRFSSRRTPSLRPPLRDRGEPSRGLWQVGLGRSQKHLAGIGPLWPTIGPPSDKLRAEVNRCWTNSSGSCRQVAAKFGAGRISPAFGGPPHTSVGRGPEATKLGPESTSLGRCRTDVDKSRPNVVRKRPMRFLIRPSLGRTRPNLVRLRPHGPESANLWPTSTNCEPAEADSGPRFRGPSSLYLFSTMPIFDPMRVHYRVGPQHTRPPACAAPGRILTRRPSQERLHAPTCANLPCCRRRKGRRLL